MSAAAPARAPALRAGHAPGRSTARSSRPSLRLVAGPRVAAGPLPFALVVASVLGAGLVALLMLHTLAAQDAFTLHKLQRQTSALGDVEQQLTVANQQAQAPSALAARARALGMLPTGALHIIRRRNGRIIAVASAVPIPVAAPSPAASTATASSTTPAPATSQAGARPTASTSPRATSSKAPAKPRRRH